MHKAQKRRIQVAQGQAKADCLIRNARVMDVFTGLIRQVPVSIVDGHFAGFSEVEAHQVVDADGLFMLPGFIDAHVHIESSMATPERFAEMVVPRGTTTVVADPHEIANVAGMDGVRYMLESARRTACDVRLMLPSCVPATPFEDAGATLGAADLAQLIQNPAVCGTAEVMNVPGVLMADADLLAKINLAAERGKQVDGHCVGFSGRELDAYVAAGVRTDHECTTVEELRERLFRGMYVHLRQGSAARNLMDLLPGVSLAAMRRCLFCSDDAHPDTLVREGHMNRHLRMAVAAGIDPVFAVSMASLNAAECYGLNKGAIAPGREADFVLVHDLRDFMAKEVYRAGKLVARDGSLVEEVRVTVPQALLGSMHVAPLAADGADFRLHVPSGKARVIGMQPGTLVSKALERKVAVDADGYVDESKLDKLTMLAVIERHKKTGLVGLGLLEGFGLKGGALATSVGHDSHNILVAGDNRKDMYKAADTLIRQGGGLVLCRKGKISGRLPLPVGGLMSAEPVATIQAALEAMLHTLHSQMGVPEGIDPFMTLSFMALPVIPELKLTPRGLFDVRRFCLTPLAL